MNKMYDTPYGDWAPVYQELGFWTRPAFNGIDKKTGERLGKACKEKHWTKPDHELRRGTLKNWNEKCATWNIGLLMGSPLSDGTLLGALDIDDDNYVRLGSLLLGNPVCGRIGKKGIVYFIRYNSFKKWPALKYKVNDKLVAEWFFRKSFVIIPPSIHPDINEPYRWVGTPLHEVDIRQLPLIKE